MTKPTPKPKTHKPTTTSKPRTLKSVEELKTKGAPKEPKGVKLRKPKSKSKSKPKFDPKFVQYLTTAASELPSADSRDVESSLLNLEHHSPIIQDAIRKHGRLRVLEAAKYLASQPKVTLVWDVIIFIHRQEFPESIPPVAADDVDADDDISWVEFFSELYRLHHSPQKPN
jgi:hypothetical protein